MNKQLLKTLMPGLIAFSMGQTVLFALAGPVFRDIGMSETQLGVIVSSAAVVFILSSTAWGRIADRWGRKRTIVFGLVSYGLISIVFALVLQLGLDDRLEVGAVFAVLLSLRLLYAALGAGIQPASVALMADLSSEDERSSAVAVVGAAFGIGMVLGPAAAALLVGFGVLTPLYVIAALGILGAGLAALGLPASTGPRETASTAPGPVAIRALLPLMLSMLLFATTQATIQQTLAFNLQDLTQLDSARTAALTGYCFMAIAVALLIVQGGVIQVFNPSARLLVRTGPPILVAGLVLYLLASGFWGVLTASLVLGIGFGLSTPGIQSAASLLAGTDDQGKVAGLMQATMSAGFVIGPLAGTFVYELNRSYSGFLALGAALAGAVLVAGWSLRQATSVPAHQA